jgi:DNA-binding transcriptional LysR family regulator
MNLEQMAYALEVAKTASITTASASLCVTQSTISQAITRLEKELGIKLFERSRNGAYPLEQAKAIFDKFKSVLDTVQMIKEDAEYIGESISGELRLSAIPGGIPAIIKAVASMKNIHADLNFELSEKPSSLIIKDIRDKQADLGLIALYQDDIDEQLQGLRFYPIDEGFMRICVNSSSALAANKTIALQDLKEQTFVLFNDELIDQFILALSSEIGDVNVLFRTNNSEVINAALQQLNAVTVGHEYSFAHHTNFQRNDYFAKELEMPQRLISIGWVLQESKASSTTIRRFLDRFQYVSIPTFN